MYIDLLDSFLKYLILIGYLRHSAVKYFLIMTIDQGNSEWTILQLT